MIPEAVEVEDIYPLSPLQEGLLFHALSGNKGLYFEQLCCTLVGELDLPAFEATWRHLLARHAVLRTAFDWEDAGAPVQVVLDRVELPIVCHDWRALSPDELRERLAALLEVDLARGFELDEPPLLRLTLVQTDDDVHRLIWSFYHLLLDGWSSPLLLDEAFTLYDAVRRGEEPHLPPVRPYRDYVAWLQTQDPSRAQGFWRRRLAGFTRPTRLEIDRHRGAGTEALTSCSQTLGLDAERTAELLAFARRHQLTLNTLVQGAWARLLSCYGGSDDVLFGVTVSGRPPQLRGVETMVGLFINSLPLRLRVPAEEPLLPWLVHLRRLQVELQPFESTPLSEVQKWSDVPLGEPLFESLLVFENYPLGKGERKGSLAIRDLESSERTNYPLTLAALPGEQLEIVLFYAGDRFEPAAIERLSRHLGTLLCTLTEEPERRLGEWSLLGESERRQLLAPWHPPAVPGEHWQAMPAAQPQVYLLDRALAPVDVGLRGAVFLAGDGLPAGDRRGPWETAEQFLPDPFAAVPGARMARTGDLGRRSPAGDLELAGALGRWVWIGGLRVDTAALEEALLSDPAVDDAAVLARPTPDGPQLVAYVVASGPWQPERLKERLGDGPATPRAFVPVARLPLLADGAVDAAALLRLPVIDAELVARWEESLCALPEIAAAAVVVGETAKALTPLHLDDLLPGWKATAAGSAAPAGAPAIAVPAGGAAGPAPTAMAPAASGVPALAYGPALILPTDAPTTLTEALERAAREHPVNGITYLRPDGSAAVQTYPELLEASQRLLGGLRELGVKPQDKLLFQLPDLADFVVAFWAAMLGGFVPVPLSIAPTYEQTNSALDKLANAWRMLDRPWILCGREILPAVCSLSTLLALPGLQVAAIDDLRRAAPDREHHPSRPDDLALLLLTSGSTGLPKAVTQTHRALLTRSAATARHNGFTPEDVSLNWMPLDHVGGIVMFNLRDVYVGCRQVHAPTAAVLADPLLWLDWIDRFRATATWAPNFAFGLINERAAELTRRHWDLSSLRFILNAGEAIVAKTALTFLALLAPHGLPATAMKPAWGMSETCSAITFSHDFTLDSTRDADSFVEVGAPIPEAAVRIVDADNRVVPEGTIGRLQVKGPMITTGYYHRPELNGEVFTPDGWFDTGDLGVLRNGQLSITGRAKDVIIIRGVNYYSHEIEAVVEEIPGVEVSYTAACPVRPPGSDTDEMAIFFHTESEDWERRIELIREIRNRVAEKSGTNPTYVIPMAREEIPKTAIGKIQRAQLRQQLEDGRLKGILKKIDLLTASPSTLPNWFYQRVWRPKRGPTPFEAIGPGLVFADPTGLGAELCRRLRRPDRPWVLAEPGTAFARLAHDRYQAVPGDREQHRRLLRSLASDGIAIDHVLHLGTYGEPGEVTSLVDLARAEERGLYDLLHLVQALAEAHGESASGEPSRRLSLLVVASHSQAVQANDPVAAERAALLGLVKTAPQEMPWLRCRHLDLPLADGVRNVSRVHREVAALNGDREVAWRDGRRLVAGLERLDLPAERAQDLPFEPGGMVLLTGGLGGIGREVAEYLLRESKARLLVVGRTPLAREGRGAEVEARLAALRLQGEVAYEAVDVANEAGLRAAIEAAEARWGCRLGGAIHLAGVLRECPLADETRDGMAAALRPKVAGTWALSRLLAERPGGFLVGFSSINAFFGGATMGAYAAANACLEGFFDALANRAGTRGTCIAWSMWDEVGMSRGYAMKKLSRARGYEVIPPRQGLQSLLAALRSGNRRLIVGIAGGNRHVRRFAEAENYGVEELAGFFTVREGAAGPAALPPLSDRFDTPSRLRLKALPELPRLATGEVDRERLQAAGGGRTAAAARTAPRSDLERQLGEIWQQLLGGQTAVGVDDNFFQLGGDSILSIQLVARAREVGLLLTTQDVFRYPTIAELAAHAGTAASLSAELEPVREIVDHRRSGDPFLYIPSDFPLARLGQEQLDRLFAGRRGIEDLYPLAPMQQGLLFHALYSPDSSLYFHQLSCTLVGELDLPAFEDAWRRVLARHSILRTAFMWNGLEEALQRVEEKVELPLERLDWRDHTAPEQEERLVRLFATDRERGFDLQQAPLLRLTFLRTAEDTWRLVWSFHHLLLDGWSAPVLLAEALTLYDGLRRGEEPRLPPVRPYRDYIAWLQRRDPAQSEAFWRRQLGGFTRPTPLGIERPAEPPTADDGRPGIAFAALDTALTASLRALARQQALTLGTLVQGAWGLLLSRYSGDQDVLFGTTVSGRPADLPGVETMVGLFINTLPLRLAVGPAEPLLPWLRQLQDLLASLRQHEHTPLNLLQGWSDVPRGRPLFDSLLVFENTPEGKASGEPSRGLEIRDVDLQGGTNYPLTLMVLPEEKLGFRVLYDAGKLDGAAVRRLIGHLATLLAGMVQDPNRSLGELPLATQGEPQSVLAATRSRRRLPAEIRSALREKALRHDEKKGIPA